jgi:hypothetical protein
MNKLDKERQMKNTIDLLKIAEANLIKLWRQFKSGQHVLICDAINAVREAMQIIGDLDLCPHCGKSWLETETILPTGELGCKCRNEEKK